MSFKVIIEQSFKKDYRRLVQDRPSLRSELFEVLKELEESGEVPVAYGPHHLSKPGRPYTGLWEFHLAEGRYDVLVIYSRHHSAPCFRLIRMGSHEELFGGV